MDGGKCPQPGCGGIIQGGFCDRCGLEPGPVAPVLAPPPASAAVSRTSFGSTTTGRSGTLSRRSGSLRGSTRRHLGLGLVTVPQVPQHDPERAVLVDPHVPDHKRFCANPDCHDAQGNPTPLQRRQSGHCPQCGRRYSFEPVLKPGDLVAGQYEVRGCLAYGGLGWIYLARDTVLGRWVVLKGLLNTADESAAAAAVAERQFLAAVKHPNIVGIYNFVKHHADGYIVMEYVAGTTVKDLRKERGPLPPAEAIAYMHRILGAFGYLHRQGLVYCDFKPENCMLEGDPPDVKLIDMGGVRRLDDPGGDVYGTRGYSAPEAGDGPTPASDLYTVGRTLAVLVMDFRFQSAFEFALPPPAEQPVLARHESLYRLLLRATARHPDHRFQSAEEMADQLAGVLREAVAGTAELPPAESALFGPDVLALADDPGAVAAAPSEALVPELKVDPDDPAANYLLTTVGGVSPAKRAPLLEAALATYPASVEVPLRLARTRLALGEYGNAEAHLMKVEAADPFDWRVTWYRARSLLAQGKSVEARDAFDRVYSELPGEPVAKLAVAVAAERAGDRATAERLYGLVARTDPSYVTATLGLARCLADAGRRADAAAAYERVPPSSSLYPLAQTTLARALIHPQPAPPSAVEVKRAADVVEALAPEGMAGAVLRAEVLEAGLTLLTSQAARPDRKTPLLGAPFQERPLRRALERLYRQMARLESDRSRQIALVDRANTVRPRTWF